jgi:hypothetical protein
MFTHPYGGYFCFLVSLYGFENFLIWDNFLIAVLGLFYGSAQLFEGLVDACKDTKYQGVECRAKILGHSFVCLVQLKGETGFKMNE